MRAQLLDHDYDPHAALQRFTDEVRKQHPGRIGGECHFVGNMRDYNEGDRVSEMFLEHYPGMTEKTLESLCTEALERWEIVDCRIMHRIGTIQPDQAIVLVAVWAGHRGAAFDACRFLIEELKHRAPFWKKEQLPEGSRWVATNTPK